MFREVSMVEVREVIRLWLAGRGPRAIARQLAIDRKTVRRYVKAATQAGLQRANGEQPLADAVADAVLSELRPGRRSGTQHGEAWRRLTEQRSFVEARLKEGLTLTKIGSLLRRQGVSVPYRTLDRFAVTELGFAGRQRSTVRVADGEPGKECQIDFGRMGWLIDPASGRRRRVYGMIFTPCYSRYHFCWLSFRQTLADVIDGCEAAWEFFGGVFEVLIADSLKAIVNRADPIAPRFNPVFWNYAQSRGFFVDPARVRHPTDKPRVERVVPYCRNSGFRGEQFRDLTQAQAWMAHWCQTEAGLRIHGTTQRRPKEHFELEELPRLKPVPTSSYVMPLFAEPKVHRDHHIEVARALYSVPDNRIGQRVQVWVEQHLVKIYAHGLLIREHPRQPPGGRSTNPDDLPKEKRGYAMRDIKYLQKQAASRGPAIGTYAARLLDSPLPWTRMRQVYRLLRLADRYGEARVESACARALAVDVVDVTRVSRMLDRGLERDEMNSVFPPAPAPARDLRFARAAQEFVTSGAGPLAEVPHA